MIKNKKQKARSMYFAGRTHEDIMRSLQLPKHRLVNYIRFWMGEREKVFEEETKNRIDQAKLLEFNLFNLIEKKASEKEINEAQLHYQNFCV